RRITTNARIVQANGLYLPSGDINPRHPLADPAEDLIRDGSGPLGYLFCPDTVTRAVCPHEHDLIPGCDIGYIGHIDHDPVHADRSYDRSAHPSDQYFPLIGE